MSAALGRAVTAVQSHYFERTKKEKEGKEPGTGGKKRPAEGEKEAEGSGAAAADPPAAAAAPVAPAAADAAAPPPKKRGRPAKAKPAEAGAGAGGAAAVTPTPAAAGGADGEKAKTPQKADGAKGTPGRGPTWTPLEEGALLAEVAAAEAAGRSLKSAYAAVEKATGRTAMAAQTRHKAMREKGTAPQVVRKSSGGKGGAAAATPKKGAAGAAGEHELDVGELLQGLPSPTPGAPAPAAATATAAPGAAPTPAEKKAAAAAKKEAKAAAKAAKAGGGGDGAAATAPAVTAAATSAEGGGATTPHARAGWTPEHDAVVVAEMEAAQREKRTQSAAFDAAGAKLSRTPKAVQRRWFEHLRPGKTPGDKAKAKEGAAAEAPIPLALLSPAAPAAAAASPAPAAAAKAAATPSKPAATPAKEKASKEKGGVSKEGGAAAEAGAPYDQGWSGEEDDALLGAVRSAAADGKPLRTALVGLEKAHPSGRGWVVWSARLQTEAWKAHAKAKGGAPALAFSS